MQRPLNLDALRLKIANHPANDQLVMCFMEAVAYAAGEPWSDSPRCASPILGSFLRVYNDRLDDGPRQTLKPYIARVIGTRGTDALENRRALMCADWIIRTHAPAWLRVAGIENQAATLANLPKIESLSAKGRTSIGRTLATAKTAARDRRLTLSAILKLDNRRLSLAGRALWGAGSCAAYAAVFRCGAMVPALDWITGWDASREAILGAALAASLDSAHHPGFESTSRALQLTIPDLLDRMISAKAEVAA